MKLTVILLTTALLNVSAKGITQSVTFAGKNVPLAAVLSAVEQQTGYVFVYAKGLLKNAKPISLEARNEPIEQFLDRIFTNQPFGYIMSVKTVLISRKETAKPRLIFEDEYAAFPITGRVLDAQGNPLSGATVTVKKTKGGKSTNTTTSSDGSFTVNANEGDILIISYVGHEVHTLTITSSTRLSSNLVIALKPSDAKLEAIQIVSTGYQRISRERATGAYDVVDQSILSKRPVSNLSTALQGTVAGLQAKENLDGTVSFLIRGAGTFNTDPTKPLEVAQPLVVVDGFAISGYDFSNINPNDIESVTVLKDAAASSIWGSRGANGVIVVTTKKPRSGKANVDAQFFTRISDMIDLDQIMNQARSADHVRYERMGIEKNWVFFPYAGGFTEIGKPLTLAQEQLFAYKNGEITEHELDNELARLSAIDNRPQIRDLLMRRAILNQANLSFSSATDKARTMASIMYENNKEGFTKRGYDRVVLNFNNSFEATKFLTVSLGANLQYKKTEYSGIGGESGTDISEIEQLSPYELLVNPDGSYGVNLYNWNRKEMGMLPLEQFPYQDWSYNLLREVRGREFTNENISARIQAGITAKLFKGLVFDAKAQYEKRKINYENYYNEETFEVRDMVNTYIEYNDATKTVGKMFLPKGGILRSGQSDYQSYALRGQLTYDRSFGGRHQVTAIAGSELTDELSTGQTNPTAYGYFPDKNQITVPPYGYGSSVNQLRSFRDPNAAVTLPTTNGDGGNTILSWRSNRLVSFYGNAGYTFDGKYSLSGSIRSDASNFITIDPKLRWSPLWSVGAMWNITRENFAKSITWLNRLTARLTYGSNGLANQSVSTETLVNISTSPSATTGTITGTIRTIGNPLLRWEKTYTTNLGFDFAMFSNKLFGKIDVYNRIGKDIVGNIALSSVTGTTTARINNAEIYNRGVEIELGTNVDISRDLTYGTTLTYAYNKNKITNLYFPALYVYDILQGQYVEGRPIGSVYSYTYLGMKDGIPYVEGPGKSEQSFNDVALHNRGLGLPFLNYEGTNIPPHTLGWINNFSYKNFNLMVVIVGTMGGKFRMPVFNYATTVGSFKTSVDRFVSDVFKGEPGIPEFPRENETQSYLWDRYTPNLNTLVESSSFIECKEINLEYFLPKQLVNKISFSNIKLYTQVRNLGLIYVANSKKYHPEWLPGTNRPLTNYVFGLNLQF